MGEAEIVSLTDYYPYGMDMPGRSFQSEAYRYGYQGSEREPETSGGAGYTTFFRALDPRIGRWLTPDPKVFPWQSPYVSMDANPVALIDPWGASTGGGGDEFTTGAGGGTSGGASTRFVDNSPVQVNTPKINDIGVLINTRIQQEFGKTITQEQFNQINHDVLELLSSMDDLNGVSYNSAYNGTTGEYVFDLHQMVMSIPFQAGYGGDNISLLEPMSGNTGSAQWLQTAGVINMWSGYTFDQAVKARMGLEKIYASEALVNNRLANGGVAGRYSVLRESAAYMQKFKTVGRLAGRGFFGVGIMFSTADGLIGYMNGDNERLYVAIIDIVISTALYASGVGIVGIPVYYILKEVLTPSGHRSQPFNLQDLSKPYYQEPDNLRIEKPLLLR